MLVLAIAALISPGTTRAQTAGPVPARVAGVVRDSSGRTIPNAVLDALAIARTRSDSSGGFVFPALPPGTVMLRITKIGYRPVMKLLRLAPGDDVTLPIVVESAGQELSAMVIREDSVLNAHSDPTGFERRRRNSVGGRFVTEDDIDRAHFSRTSQLFTRFAGVYVSPGGMVSVKRGVTTIGGTSCGSVQVLLDGIILAGISVDDLPISAIHGIEVYSGPATTPGELRTSQTVCGTVAIWTK